MCCAARLRRNEEVRLLGERADGLCADGPGNRASFVPVLGRWLSVEEARDESDHSLRYGVVGGLRGKPAGSGPLPPFTDRWKWLYKLRMSIERIFRSLKHSRGLEGHCVRGLKKIKLLAAMSLVTYQATVLMRLKAKDEKRMRVIAVKVRVP